MRDCYITATAAASIVVTDRLSAFDVVLGTHPVQGAGAEPAGGLLVRGAASIAPNHVLAVPDPNVMVGASASRSRSSSSCAPT